jgi:uncharacterized damage-inducible protein DinB
MSNIETFERLFRWDAWANGRVIGALEALKAPPRRAVDRMAHVCRAQELWLSRMGNGEWAEGRSLFPEGADLEEVALDAQVLAARWAQVFRVLRDDSLDETIVYNTTEGEPFETRRRDILLQLTHHGSYHRGQVAVDMKGEGHACPATDYIFFVRTEVV